MIKILALTAVLFALTFPAMAEEAAAPAVTSWTVDPASSEISFSGTHADNEFTGKFKTWSAEIDFDPAKLEQSKVSVTIDTGSAETGDKTYDGSLPSPEWLGPKAFPTATFESKAFRQTGDTTYEVDGTLSLKGVTQDITLPFSLTIEGDKATMEATTTLDRLLYKIGTASDPKAEWVSKDITVAIKVSATKAP